MVSSLVEGDLIKSRLCQGVGSDIGERTEIVK